MSLVIVLTNGFDTICQRKFFSVKMIIITFKSLSAGEAFFFLNIQIIYKDLVVEFNKSWS